MDPTDLTFFDFETTGTDPYRDRIVELALIQIRICADRVPERTGSLVSGINPGVPIPPEASAVHGITDADVEDCATFAELADAVEDLVEGAVLVGYNSRRFDTPLLDAELRRAGRPGLPRDDRGFLRVPEIDLLAMWHRMEPRTLAGAAARFAGTDLEGAHKAEDDTEALAGILTGMAAEWDLDLLDVGGLMSLTHDPQEVDRDGRFRRSTSDGNAEIVFAFGKNEGRPAASDRDYLEWMLSADFPPETRAVCRAILAGEEV